MSVPAHRTPVRIARGLYADLAANLAVLEEGEIVWAEDHDQLYVVEGSAPTSRLVAASSGSLVAGNWLGVYDASSSSIAAVYGAASSGGRTGFVVGGKVSAGSGQGEGDHFIVTKGGTPTGDAAPINVPLNTLDRISWTGTAWTVIASGHAAGTMNLHDAADVSDSAVVAVAAANMKGVLVRDATVADGAVGAYKLVDVIDLGTW